MWPVCAATTTVATAESARIPSRIFSSVVMRIEPKYRVQIHYAFPYNNSIYRIDFKSLNFQIMAHNQQMSSGGAKIIITPKQRRKLEEVFGEKGTSIVIAHIDELDETFGSAAVVIRRLIDKEKDDS